MFGSTVSDTQCLQPLPQRPWRWSLTCGSEKYLVLWSRLGLQLRFEPEAKTLWLSEYYAGQPGGEDHTIGHLEELLESRCAGNPLAAAVEASEASSAVSSLCSELTRWDERLEETISLAESYERFPRGHRRLETTPRRSQLSSEQTARMRQELWREFLAETR